VLVDVSATVGDGVGFGDRLFVGGVTVAVGVSDVTVETITSLA
jgi:hypothetical protein